MNTDALLIIGLLALIYAFGIFVTIVITHSGLTKTDYDYKPIIVEILDRYNPQGVWRFVVVITYIALWPVTVLTMVVITITMVIGMIPGGIRSFYKAIKNYH